MASILSTSKTQLIAKNIFSEFEDCFNQYKTKGTLQFEAAIELMLETKGKIIFCGLGKTGYIANYAATLFSSLNIPSQFLHANEALHGDMGLIDRNKDLMVYISFSGKGEEHLFLANNLKMPSILISGNAKTPMSKIVDVNLDIGLNKNQESSPLHCTPTHSNVLFMLIVNTLAMIFCSFKNIQASDFSKNHPGGQIGREMFLKVDAIMRKKETLPTTSKEHLLFDALPIMTSGCCGAIMITNENNQLLGIFTDGDLRRALNDPNNLSKPVEGFANVEYKTCSNQMLAIEALDIMRTHKITSLIVTDTHKQWLGLIHIHDILRATQCSDTA